MILRAAPLRAFGRTFGWYRVYKGFIGHRKFRAVARATGIEFARVQCVVLALIEEANDSQPRGSLADFDVFDCAATLEVEPEEVARIYAELEFRQWIVNDQIATWNKRQPDREDPAATERKRASRDNLKATRQMLAAPPQPVELPPVGDGTEDAAISRMYWLHTVARKAVADRLRTKETVAQVIVHGWLRDARKDHAAVAAIISGALELGLEGEAFRNQVAQRIRALKQETPGQRPLPLRFTAISGK